jgi:hypothetical protein
MRKNILLLSAAILFAACADDQHATAPNGPRSGAASRSVDLPPGPSAKPIDQIGWTQAVTVVSTSQPVSPGTSGFATATCPIGTTVVGGGYTLDFGPGAAPAVYHNIPIGGTGWNAGVQNMNAAGGANVSVTAFARCAS